VGAVRFRSTAFKVNFEIEFNHRSSSAARRRRRWISSTTSFLKEVSRARTFGFMRDLETLRSQNLRSRNLDNAIVLERFSGC